MLHPYGQGEVVTQPPVGIRPIYHRHLGSLAAIEPVDEAAVLAVVHRESCGPVGCGARHRQQVNLSRGSTYREGKESGMSAWEKIRSLRTGEQKKRVLERWL